MKKLLLPILSTISFALFAQSIVITNYSGDTLNSGTYVAHGDELDVDTAKLLTYLSNDFAVDKEVSVTKYDLNVCSNTGNYFCWQQCYLESAVTGTSPFVSPDKLLMSPGVADSNFSAYHKANGQTGNAKFRFVWKIKGESDSVYVDVEFQIAGECTAQSISEKYKSNFKIYPNPTNNILNLYNGNKSNYNVDVVNILGEKVIKQRVVNSKELAIDVSSLKTGIYFVRIFEDGDLIDSKKLNIN